MITYDLRGLKCPIPVLKAFKLIKEKKDELEFTFLTDDKSAPGDFKDFSKNIGYIFIGVNKKTNYEEIKIRKPNSEK